MKPKSSTTSSSRNVAKATTTTATPDQLLEKFVKVLRLQDWDITLEVMNEQEYQEKHGEDFAFDTNGCTEIMQDQRTANIYLKDSLTEEQSFETLLHECIHLVTSKYDSFVRDTLIYVDSRKIAKKFKNEACWEMELQVARLTAILKPLLKKEI